MMTNPVVTFLTTRNGYTFEEGVAVLAMYTNRQAVERVRRSRDIRLLQHELKKLAHEPGLKPIPGKDVPSVPKTEEIVPTPNETVPEPGEKFPKAEENFPKVPENSQNREPDETVNFDDLKHHKYTREEDMPTEETKALWRRNNERWHRKIDLFAKMKLLLEGEELAATRKELVELSREHRECWKMIDQKIKEYFAEKEKEQEQNDQPNFNISTYRTYICEKANLEKLSDKQFLELQRRVDAMKEANIALSDETLEKLRAKGIKC